MRPHPDDLLTVNVEGEEESWLISYLDMLTLILTLFALLLSFSSMKKPGAEAENASPRQQPHAVPRLADILPASSGLKPQEEQLAESLQKLDLKGVEATPGREGMTLRIDDRLLFSSGSAELTAGGKAVIGKLQPLLAEFDGEVSIEGHTDDRPIMTDRFPSNWELSTGRAIAVLRHLASQGHPVDGLRAVGYADTQPLASNDSEAGRAENRRVELVLRER